MHKNFSDILWGKPNIVFVRTFGFFLNESGLSAFSAVQTRFFSLFFLRFSLKKIGKIIHVFP
ncbi:hypothetical protein CH363_18525 [Leptospira haakeii]|uniref:Uncharacterized protein n=1 Tax=Leptospira haakeii TaxID=2023198 RepID=A0ABX4PHV8_9LEPT|nr:hypothetical protein CH363_18525 [Leptospira haakeii]PKA18437.1 hypothetical protein CH377_17900 [Leptospira haakeii]